MRSRHALLAMPLALLIWPFPVAADRPAPPSGRSALVVLSSKDSHIRKKGFRRISTATEWNKLWQEHVGKKFETFHRPSMEIDFKRCMVIAIFGGESYNSWGYRVEEIRENKSTVFLRYSNIGYKTGVTMGDPGGFDNATPYAFVVLRNSKKPVVLEETTHTMDGQHITRKTGRLRFPSK